MAWFTSRHVTCGLTACTPGSAPGPTFGNEYGKTLPFLDSFMYSLINSRVSTYVPLYTYMDPKTKQGHSCYGMLIGSHMWSIKQWRWPSLTLGQYLENVVCHHYHVQILWQQLQVFVSYSACHCKHLSITPAIHSYFIAESNGDAGQNMKKN